MEQRISPVLVILLGYLIVGFGWAIPRVLRAIPQISEKRSPKDAATGGIIAVFFMAVTWPFAMVYDQKRR